MSLAGAQQDETDKCARHGEDGDEEVGGQQQRPDAGRKGRLQRVVRRDKGLRGRGGGGGAAAAAAAAAAVARETAAAAATRASHLPRARTVTSTHRT